MLFEERGGGGERAKGVVEPRGRGKEEGGVVFGGGPGVGGGPEEGSVENRREGFVDRAKVGAKKEGEDKKGEESRGRPASAVAGVGGGVEVEKTPQGEGVCRRVAG